MNEKLRGVKKNNQVYQILFFEDDVRVTDLAKTMRRGYVNWPLAVESKSTKITHLPSGMLCSPSYFERANNFTEAKAYIDYAVALLGEQLCNLDSNPSLQSKWLTILRKPYEAVVVSKNESPDKIVIDGVITIKGLKAKLDKTAKVVTLIVGADEITVDNKVLIKALNSIVDRAVCQFRVSNEYLETYKKNIEGNLFLANSGEYRCLTCEYESGIFNLREVVTP